MLPQDLLIEYAGFWRRLFAALVDSMLVSLVMSIGVALWLGPEKTLQLATLDIHEHSMDYQFYPLEQIIPALITLIFWSKWGATPGKMVVDCRIVDADTLQPASVGQLVLRYLCYLVSTLPLFLGFLWIAFSTRKQGWHDKLANTLVILNDEALCTMEDCR